MHITTLTSNKVGACRTKRFDELFCPNLTTATDLEIGLLVKDITKIEKLKI